MRAFHQLSEQGQIRRLRQLAVRGLERWPLQVQRMRPLTFWENATWRVDALEGSFLLRVHREGYRDLPAIEAELDWIEALHEAGLRVQRPLRSLEGERVLEVEGPGGERRHLSLLSWIEGRRRLKPRRRHAEAIGRLLARMHAAVEGRPPQARQAWDGEGWFAPLPTGEPRVDEAIAPADRALLERASEELLERTAALGRGPEVFGAIHSDLHFGNLIWQGDQPVPIDFDDGGPGWFAMDLAVPSTRLRAQDPELAEAMVQAYCELRSLSEEELALARAMPALRALLVPGWLAQRLGSAAVREALPHSLERWLGRLRAYYGQAS